MLVFKVIVRSLCSLSFSVSRYYPAYLGAASPLVHLTDPHCTCNPCQPYMYRSTTLRKPLVLPLLNMVHQEPHTIRIASYTLAAVLLTDIGNCVNIYSVPKRAVPSLSQSSLTSNLQEQKLPKLTYFHGQDIPLSYPPILKFVHAKISGPRVHST